MSARAIIADDHPLFREALKQAVQSVLGGVILEAEDFTGVMEHLRSQPEIELLFLDINMPGNEGLTGLTTIHNAFPSVEVIMVSAQEDALTIRKAMDFGASGFIPKSSPISLIESAIEYVLEGEQWLPEGVQDQIDKVDNQETVEFAEKLNLLTPHQFSVLKLLADGLLNKQIAYELNVQETTIKQHVSAVLRKLGVYNRTQAGVIFKQAMGNEGNNVVNAE